MVSIIIPAYNEENYLPITLHVLDQHRFWDEIIVVNDGSIDQTGDVVLPPGVQMVHHHENQGKGSALATGIRYSKGDLLLFLDADLGKTAFLGRGLIPPVEKGSADMTIARFPPAGKSGGFGIVKAVARTGIKTFTGVSLHEPLSGQRCLHRKVVKAIPSFAHGFGIEVAITLDVLRAGYRIKEVEIPFTHRGLGRTWQGFRHRGRELKQIIHTLWMKRKG